MKENEPREELLCQGHTACPGCGGAILMRHFLKTIGKDLVLVIPACCWTIVSGLYPKTSIKVPVVHCAFESAAATAAGVKAGLRKKGDLKTQVAVFAGDGSTFDIGFAGVSGAAERNDDFIYICDDNEAYMNTGTQRSSATPKGAWTTTTPREKPKLEAKKDIVRILADHQIPYAATASVGYIEDLTKKIETMKQLSGFRFLHVLSPCPPGWRSLPQNTFKIARLAVQTGIFPLYEIKNGQSRVTVDPSNKKPVKEYFELQGRFAHLL